MGILAVERIRLVMKKSMNSASICTILLTRDILLVNNHLWNEVKFYSIFIKFSF